MASTKSKIKFNKIRNKGENLKAKLKKEKKVKNNPKKANKNGKEKKRINKRKIGYWILIGITSCAILFIVLMIIFAIYIVQSAPEFDEDKLFDKESSIIYDINGNELATLGMSVGDGIVEKRIKLTYDQFPQVLIDAVVATEDSRFFQHNGVDLARFLKASVQQVLGQSGAGGASTLTMQVSKNGLTDTTSEGFDGIKRKFTDIYLSVFKIEKAYTKQEILELYLNSGFLGENSFGVEQASQTYFGKSAKDLSLSEAALIAGLFQAPTAYDPYINPENAKARRNQVLNLMQRHGYISEEVCEAAKAMPLKEMLQPQSSNTNPYQGYIDTVVEEVINKYGVNPYTVSLEIYTYFDSGKQDVINNIYNGNLGYQFKDDQIDLAVAVIDNSNGAILAVGTGRNQTGNRSWNHATMDKKHPGSTIKPILDYGPAFEYLNWSTYTPLFDEEIKYTGSTATLRNWNGKYEGMITAKTALSKSMNTAALLAFQSTTNEQKWDFATKLGITPENDNGKIFESASIGAFDGTNPVELAGAYSAFANGGYYTEPHSVQKIKFMETGEESEKTYTRERVMKETTAYLITNILFNVTPSTATVYGTQIATKTGTSSYPDDMLREYGLSTNVIRDSWVATYNPEYTITFWYAYDKFDPEYVNYMSNATSNRNQIQGLLTKNIMNTGSSFTMPKGITSSKVEFGTIPARLPSEYTPADLIETHLFISGTEPTEVSNRYSGLSNPTNLKVVEEKNSAKVTWTSPGIPDAANEEYLRQYFSTSFRDWANKYLEQRLEYNRNSIGDFGFDIYLKKGDKLNFVAHTTDTSYTVNNISGYDAIVVKSAYSIFKANASSGVEEKITGTATSFKIDMKAVETSDGFWVNPKYKVGDTIPDLGIKTILFLVDDVDVTSTINSKDMSYQIRDCTETCKDIKEIDSSVAGAYEVVYTVNYMGVPYKETRKVYVE